jgi:hypothetical protein
MSLVRSSKDVARVRRYGALTVVLLIGVFMSWSMRATGAASPHQIKAPIQSLAVPIDKGTPLTRTCGTEKDLTFTCGDNQVCCHVSFGVFKCCPAAKPYACMSPKQCYATEEEATIHCEVHVVDCS